MHGGEVARYCLDGRIKEVADYCETDIVNTYRVWLRYELFRGRLTNAELEATETALFEFIKNTRQHEAAPHRSDAMIILEDRATRYLSHFR
jgi:predicted PolB exonuclease-like 3'-5' exonuclease